MSLNSTVATFQAILDRDDCTATQAQAFVLQGISRVQRDCRLPSMERALLMTPTEPMSWFVVPIDLIQPIDVLVLEQDGRWKALNKLPYRELVRRHPLTLPHSYARSQTQIWIAGPVPAGTQLQFLYYGNFSAFAADGSTDNELTASTPDLPIYGALSYAADTFQHPSGPQWEARYQAIKSEVEAMAIDLDAEGGFQTMQPVYPIGEA